MDVEPSLFEVLVASKNCFQLEVLALKNKEEINFLKIFVALKLQRLSDLIFRLDFLLDNLFLCFGHCTYTQCSTGIPMGTNCAIYLANFYLFSYEFDFLKCLFKNNACGLHRLYLVCRIVDDLFVADFPDFLEFYVHRLGLF